MIANRAEVQMYLGKSTLTDAELGLLSMLHPLVEQSVIADLGYNPAYTLQTELLPIGQPTGVKDNLDDYDVVNAVVISGRAQGNGRFLALKHLPVWDTASLEVREDIGANAGQFPGAFADSSLLIKGRDYWLDGSEFHDVNGSATLCSRTGRLGRFAVWPREPRCVKVQYHGGWTREQLDNGPASPIKMAVVLTMVKAWKQATTLAKVGTKAGPVTSESIGKYSYSIDTNTLNELTSFTASLPQEARMLLQPFKNYGNLL